MRVKHVISSYSDEFEQKLNAALSSIKGEVVDVKYLYDSRYFTALITYKPA